MSNAVHRWKPFTYFSKNYTKLSRLLFAFFFRVVIFMPQDNIQEAIFALKHSKLCWDLPKETPKLPSY